MGRRRSKSWYISRLVRQTGFVKEEVLESTGITDSDLKVVADLRNDIDSDFARTNTRLGTVESSSTDFVTASDSDRNASHSPRVYRISSTAELDVINQNTGLGTRKGVARVGDIAYIANPFKAYILTNILADVGTTYNATGFRVQTGNGTVTRMTFDIIPSGQTAAENFAVGMQISNRTYARDVRTITAVTSTYLDFTPSDAGYPPGWDNEYVYTQAAAQTTWQKFSFDSEHIAAIITEAGVGGFDSDQIVAIINENTTAGSIDSDVAAVAALRRDADSDSARIQAIATQIEGLNVLVDSDLKAISDLRNDLDSESGRISALGGGGGSSTNLTQTVFTFTTTAPQSTFTGADDNGQTLSYTVGKIQVYLNGLLLTEGASKDYTATNGTSVVLTEASDSDDILTVVKFLATQDDVLTTRYVYKVTSGGHSAGDSEFTGADDNGAILSYTAGKIQVFLNGILLNDSDDYTATNGSSVLLTTAPDSDDVLSIYRYLGTQVAGFDSDQVVGIVYENVAEALTTTNPHTVKGARFGRRRNGLDSDGTPEYHLKLVGAASIATDSEDDINDARYFSEKKVCRLDYALGQSDICIISYGEPHNQEGTGYYDAHIIKYDYAGHNGGSGSGARSDASWGLRTVNGTWTSSQMSAGSTIGSPPAITVTHDTSNKRFIVKSNGQPYGTYSVEIVSGRYAIDVEWLV
tara:strand:- start:6503 stop:8587 length:2085 start_codon:yes stop_codon:yes gene_type:complete